MIRVTAAVSIALICLALMFSNVSGGAGERGKLAAYYTLVTHLTLEEFLSVAGTGGEYPCEDRNDLRALDYAESFRDGEIDDRGFLNHSVLWGVLRNGTWIVILNGYSQLHFKDGRTIRISEGEFDTLLTMIRADFTDTSCGW